VRKSYKTNQLLFNLVTTSLDLPQFDLNAFSKLLQDIFKDRFAGLLHLLMMKLVIEPLQQQEVVN